MTSNYLKDFAKPYKFKRFKDLIIDKSDLLKLENRPNGLYLNNHLITKRVKKDLLFDYIEKSFNIKEKSNDLIIFQRVLA